MKLIYRYMIYAVEIAYVYIYILYTVLIICIYRLVQASGTTYDGVKGWGGMLTFL